MKAQEEYVATLRLGEDWKLSYGASWVGWYYGGYWYWPASDQLVVTISACTDVAAESYIWTPGAWAFDDAIAGPNAFTREYLEGNPPVSDLEKRVEGIKKYLDARKQIGRGGMKVLLRQWLKLVKKEGITYYRPECINPVLYGNPVTINRFSRGTETQVLFVRGTWPHLEFSWNR